MDKIILKIYHLDNSRPAFYAIVTKLNKRQAKTFSKMRLFTKILAEKLVYRRGSGGFVLGSQPALYLELVLQRGRQGGEKVEIARRAFFIVHLNAPPFFCILCTALGENMRAVFLANAPECLEIVRKTVDFFCGCVIISNMNKTKLRRQKGRQL